MMTVFAWLRFGAVAAFLILALACFISEVIGFGRFGFVMNRMHAAGIGDSLGLFSVCFALMLASGTILDAAKIALVVTFMWFSSPASTHFLGQVEFYTNARIYRYVDRGPAADAVKETKAGAGHSGGRESARSAESTDERSAACEDGRNGECSAACEDGR